MSHATFDPPTSAPAGSNRSTLTKTSRSTLVAGAVGLAAVLGIARWVQPDPRGYGTHEQLGLPPCAFRVLTRIPCPACGLTTSFAYVVRGEFGNAAVANIGGCLMALAAAGAVPWCLASAAAGRTLGIRSPEQVVTALLLAFVAVSFAGWLGRFLFFRGQG